MTDTGKVFPLFILAGMAILILFYAFSPAHGNLGPALAGLLNDHAMNTHGDKAVKVVAAYECGGSMFRMENPFTGRHADVCQVDQEEFGVLITEANKDPVTVILKEKLRDIKQVINYLQNRGYIFP